MIGQWLLRIWPSRLFPRHDSSYLPFDEDPAWHEMRRYDGIVRAASDAALADTPVDLPAIRDRNLGTTLGPIHGVACYVFETDADLALATERKLTDWLTEATRHQLLLHGYPAHVIDHFNVSFVSHEEIVRKAGGNYHHFFN